MVTVDLPFSPIVAYLVTLPSSSVSWSHAELSPTTPPGPPELTCGGGFGRMHSRKMQKGLYCSREHSTGLLHAAACEKMYSMCEVSLILAQGLNSILLSSSLKMANKLFNEERYDIKSLMHSIKTQRLFPFRRQIPFIFITF